MKLNSFLIFIILLSGGCAFILQKKVEKLFQQKERYQQTSVALMTDLKRLQIDSLTMAVDVYSLKLTLAEYKRYREEDAERIKRMGIELKSLKAAAKHTIEIHAPFDTYLKDTIVMRDTSIVRIQRIDMKTPYLEIDGIIEQNHVLGRVSLPVNLQQAIWIEYKHRLLWWRWGIKGVHQTISSDNPHVEIKYSEVIQIDQ